MGIKTIVKLWYNLTRLSIESSNIVQKLTVGFDFIRVVFEQVDELIAVNKLNSYHVSYIIVLK